MPCSNCDCPFQEIRALNGSDLSAELQCMLDDSVQRVTFRHGEILFMQGQPSSCLFAISDGMVKICTHNADGREQIVGLSSAQSILVGLQSLNDDRYAYSAIAASNAARERIGERSRCASDRPAERRCRWASIRPGITTLPVASYHPLPQSRRRPQQQPVFPKHPVLLHPWN